MDEHAPSFLERLAAVAVVTAPESRAHSSPWATDPDCIAAAAREVLLEAARILPLIVVGHGGNCLFRDRPDVLRSAGHRAVRRPGPAGGPADRRAAPQRPPPRSGARTPTGSNTSSAITRAT